MILLFYLSVIFICLFVLFAISRHDFVLLRQSITLRQIFDNAFIAITASFIMSRLGYIIYSAKLDLLNPLQFFYVTRYWGTLPFIGLLSMLFSLYILFRRKKNILRIFDIYFISFSPLILLDIALKSNIGINLLLKIVSLIVLFVFYIWFVRIHNKFDTKDGFITSLIFITYSLVSLAFSYSNMGFFTFKYAWYQILLLLTALSFTGVLVLVQKNFFVKK